MKKPGQSWFPAKQYGWGWGPPTVWQGWLVLLVYIVLLVLGTVFFPPGRETVYYVLYTLALTLLLIVVCWLKGEPPKWRWGKLDDKDDL